MTESQIEDARGQRKATESLIETIIRTGQAKESDIAKCYATVNGMTYVDLTSIPAPDKTIIDLIDLDVVADSCAFLTLSNVLMAQFHTWLMQRASDQTAGLAA